MPNAYSVFHLSLDMDIYFKITTSVCRDTEIESEVVWLHSSQIFFLSVFTVSSRESWCLRRIMTENPVEIKIDLKF